MRVAAILNPVAGGGLSARSWPAVQTALVAHFGPFSTHMTTKSDDAGAIAYACARGGADTMLVCGGDGTMGEAANGLMRYRDETGVAVRLGLLPAGSGRDLVRSLNLPSSALENVARIAQGRWRSIDAGRVSFVDDDGAPRTRCFLNIASVGVSGPTDRAVNAARLRAPGAGRLLFLFHALRALVKYRFETVRVAVDDHPPIETAISLVAVANGRFFGAGMMIAPDAQIDDGLFDVVILKADSKLRLIRQMNLLYTGAHIGQDITMTLRGRRIVITPAGDPQQNAALVDMDGESPGRIPAAIEILPRAIEVQA